MFEFQLSFYPRIWNTLALVSGFTSGTPFSLQTSTEKQNQINPTTKILCFTSHATETTVVLKTPECTVLLLLQSVLQKIWPKHRAPSLRHWRFCICIVTLFHQQSHHSSSCPHTPVHPLPLSFSQELHTEPLLLPVSCPGRRHDPSKGLKQPGSGYSSFHEALRFASTFQLHQLTVFVPRMSPSAWLQYSVAHFGKPTAVKEQDFLNPKAEPPISHCNIH